MERHFEKDLNEMKERLLWMGSLAERAVHQSVHAVLESDEQLAKRVLEEEDAINELQMEVDDRVVQLLALHQLMAIDLRFGLAVSRLNKPPARIAASAPPPRANASSAPPRAGTPAQTPPTAARLAGSSRGHRCLQNGRRPRTRSATVPLLRRICFYLPFRKSTRRFATPFCVLSAPPPKAPQLVSPKVWKL